MDLHGTLFSIEIWDMQRGRVEGSVGIAAYQKVAALTRSLSALSKPVSNYEFDVNSVPNQHIEGAFSWY